MSGGRADPDRRRLVCVGVVRLRRHTSYLDNTQGLYTLYSLHVMRSLSSLNRQRIRIMCSSCNCKVFVYSVGYMYIWTLIIIGPDLSFYFISVIFGHSHSLCLRLFIWKHNYYVPVEINVICHPRLPRRSLSIH